MEENIILKYFDVYYDDTSRPKVSIKLKSKFKDGIEPPKRPSGYPYSGVELEYYIGYLGNDIGSIVHKERKKLCSKVSILKWYLDNCQVSDAQRNDILTEIDMIGKRVSKSLNEHYSSPEGEATRSKLRKRSKHHAKRIGQINAEKWKDEEWRATQIQNRHASGMYKRIAESNRERMKDPIFKDKFLKACNKPDRIRSISNAAKKMWSDARKNDRDKFRRMLMSQKNKNFELDGYSMNSIEFQVAAILNKLNVKWDYEPIIHLGDNSYVPDFLANDTIIIECFGDYWHANPKYFEPTDTTHKTRTAAEVWEYDKEKLLEYKKNSYITLVLWETDINYDIEYCKKMIKDLL